MSGKLMRYRAADWAAIGTGTERVTSGRAGRVRGGIGGQSACFGLDLGDWAGGAGWIVASGVAARASAPF